MKGDVIGPGPEDLPGAGDALGDLAGIGLGPLHGRIAEIGDDHVDRQGVPVTGAGDQVDQFLVGGVVRGVGDNHQIVAGDIARERHGKISPSAKVRVIISVTGMSSSMATERPGPGRNGWRSG